jgi:hypothetical protein
MLEIQLVAMAGDPGVSAIPETPRQERKEKAPPPPSLKALGDSDHRVGGEQGFFAIDQDQAVHPFRRDAPFKQKAAALRGLERCESKTLSSIPLPDEIDGPVA